MTNPATKIEWAVRYTARGVDAFQMCDDIDHAVSWQPMLPQPNEIVCRVVTRTPWEVAKVVSS